MSHPDPLKHALRLTAVDALSGPLPYTAYSVGEREYLGAYDSTLDDLVTDLDERGYHYQLFAARKSNSGGKDVGSYARIPKEHPRAVAGTQLATLNPGECQYHVHPIPTNDGFNLYGHYEIHPYPHTPTWDVTRMWPRHYRPTYDSKDNPRKEWTYLRGVTDERLQPLLTTTK